MQILFLILAVIGAVVPLMYFIPFVLTNGFDLPLIVSQLFQNNVSASFGLDVIISAFVLFVFVFSEGRRRRMKHLWIYVVCTSLIGVSLGLPLFLLFRERSLNTSAARGDRSP